jgi:hypothetical protein
MHKPSSTSSAEFKRYNNLVISSGYGYPPAHLAAFLKSISRNMKSADVVLFYHDTSEQTVSHLRNYLYRVKVIKPSDHVVRQAISILPRGRIITSKLINHLGQKLVKQPYSPLLTGSFNVVFARHFWATEYCERLNMRLYKRVMLCDSRDVVVQSDVFDKVTGFNFVTGGEERRIRECPANRNRILEYYGKDALRSFWDEVIVCAGVSVGPGETVLEYLRAVTQEVKRMSKLLVGRQNGDQGIHNYLIRSNALKFPVHVTKSKDGIIGTLHYYDKDALFVGDAGNISVENGVAPSVIHQYDRFPKLSEHVARIYGS